MKGKRVLRLASLLALLGSGVGLLRQPGNIAPEPAERRAALSALAPAGSGLNRALPQTAATLEAVNPVSVNLAEIDVSYDFPDSMYERWVNGELDLEQEFLVSDAEWADLQAAALTMGPSAGVQVLDGLSTTPDERGGNAWEAINFTQSGGSIPPDPEMAVGPNHVVAVVNVALAIYEKSGTPLFGPAPAANLFTGLSSCQTGLYDPNVVYDEEAGRWIILYDQGAYTAGGGFCVAASQTNDPTGAWNIYFFNVNTGSAWVDYPHTGVGDSYIFTGGNLFTYAGSFVEGRIWAFNKASLYAGNSVAPITRGVGGPATPQPLNLHGFARGTWPSYGNTHYFLADGRDGRNYPLLQWNPASGAFSNLGDIDLGAGGAPIDNVQGGTGGLIQGNDYRPQDFEYRNGYGWTTSTISCNPGSGTVNCARWAQIDIAGAALGPAGVGVISSAGDYRYFPDVAANHCNDAVIGYTGSDSGTFPSVYVSTRTSTTPPGQILAEGLIKAGEITYVDFGGPPYRWGDYTGLTIDPDGYAFWYLGQYSENTGTTTGRWGTYIYTTTNPGCTGAFTDFLYLPVAILD